MQAAAATWAPWQTVAAGRLGGMGAAVGAAGLGGLAGGGQTGHKWQAQHDRHGARVRTTGKTAGLSIHFESSPTPAASQPHGQLAQLVIVLRQPNQGDGWPADRQT